MIDFKTNYLENLENDKALKSRYAGMGAFTQNKIIFIPVVLLILSFLILYFLYDDNALASSYGAITIGVIVLSILAIIFIRKNAKKKILENLDQVKISLGKKVYGNDKAQIYYVIYTTGKERHNPDFIYRIAERVFNVDKLDDVDEKTKKKISKMFGERANFSGFEKLPTEFTLGNDVYLKTQNFAILSKEMKDIIKANNDTLPLIVFPANNAIMISEKNLS